MVKCKKQKSKATREREARRSMEVKHKLNIFKMKQAYDKEQDRQLNDVRNRSRKTKTPVSITINLSQAMLVKAKAQCLRKTGRKKRRKYISKVKPNKSLT